MSLKTYPDLEQGSDEWLEARRGILTASVIGQLITPTLKVANNDTTRGLLATLVAERITGWIEPVYVSDDMFRGRMDEPLARELYRENYAPVREYGFMTREIGGTTVGYSPDGVIGGDGLIEIKSRKPKKHLQTILSGEVPAENMAQLQCGLLISGRQWIDYVSYCGGMPMWVKRVESDLAWFEVIFEAASTFEANAALMVAEYAARTAGLPPTTRIEYFPEARI